MAHKVVIGKILLKSLQRYHQSVINVFGEHETLVDAVAGRPGFFAPSPVAFLSLVARRSSIRIDDLNEAVLNDRTLVRVNSFRGSLLLLSTADYPIYFRALSAFGKILSPLLQQNDGISPKMINRCAERLKEHDSAVPVPHHELIDILFRGCLRKPPQAVEHLLVRKMCDQGIIIRAAAKGWKGNQFHYIQFNKWLPDTLLRLDNPESARMETVRKYLKCYGPASLDDIAWWTGLPINHVRKTVANLRREAIKISVEAHREELIALRETYDAINSCIEDSSLIQLLPPWDPFLLGWSNRRRVVHNECAPYVYDPKGNSTSVIVHRGRVIGLWQFRDFQTNVLEFHLFGRYQYLKQETVRACEQHARILAEISGATTVDIIEKSLPVSLENSPPHSFLWPLGKTSIPRTTYFSVTTQPEIKRSSNTFKGSYLDHRHVIANSLPG